MDILSKVLKNPMLWVAAIYLLLPVDLIPDAVPVVGTLDDLVPIFISLILQARMGHKKQ